MNTSLQIAEECLKEDGAKSRVGRDGSLGDDGGQQFEGVQKFAQTIDSGINIVHFFVEWN